MTLYNEQNVLRVEMTMNRPDLYKVFRHPQEAQDAPKRHLLLWKGIADLPLRARVANNVNNCFIGQLATLEDVTPVHRVLAEVDKQSPLCPELSPSAFAARPRYNP